MLLVGLAVGLLAFSDPVHPRMHQQLSKDKKDDYCRAVAIVEWSRNLLVMKRNPPSHVSFFENIYKIIFSLSLQNPTPQQILIQAIELAIVLHPNNSMMMNIT